MTVLTAILTENFADWQFGMLAGVARGNCDIDVVTAAPATVALKSMGGLRVQPDLAIHDIDLYGTDAIAVIGGGIWDGSQAPDFSELLTIAHGHGKVIGAIGGATRALAAAGLLDNIPHTSNDIGTLAAVPAYRGHAQFVASATALKCGRVITASGLAPVSFMRAMLAALGHESVDVVQYAERFSVEFGMKPRQRLAA
jgi:putative intracellular protease/amidase